MTVDEFFKNVFDNTQENYRKLPQDLERNFSNYGSLTQKQAEWIENAIKRNRKLRSLEIPEEIQYEMDVALNRTNELPDLNIHAQSFLDQEELRDIILDEIALAVTRVMERLAK